MKHLIPHTRAEMEEKGLNLPEDQTEQTIETSAPTFDEAESSVLEGTPIAEIPMGEKKEIPASVSKPAATFPNLPKTKATLPAVSVSKSFKKIPFVKREKSYSQKVISPEKMPVYSLFLLEDVFPHARRHAFLRLFGLVILLAFFLAFLSLLFLFSGNSFSALPFSISPDALHTIIQKASGIFFVGFSFWCFVYVLETFYRSLYYHNREHVAKTTGRRDVTVSEVIEYFHDDPSGDILRMFLLSALGKMTMLRLGIGNDEVENFLKQREDKRTVSFFEIEQNGIITREDLAKYLFEKYQEFSQFLFRHNISKEIFLSTLSWMVELDLRDKFQERWWSRDRLAKIPGLGNEWSYGAAFALARYSRDISGNAVDETSADFLERRKKYVTAVETILSKQTEANVLLIGDEGVGKEDILRDIAGRVSLGNTTPELVAHRMVELDTALLVSSTQTKNNFELEFMSILSDAQSAGNVILVFPDFAGFLESAHASGSDALGILDRYLDAAEFRVVALANKSEYHQFFETNSQIASRFQTVTMEEPGFESVVGILEERALFLEQEYELFFTYPALLEVAKAAVYYIAEGVMPDKALDLLVEIAPAARENGDVLVTKEVVQAYVSQKTHIPMGKIDEEEKDKLENLEESLHALVIGQEKAIEALSDALRRSRAGIRNLEKPIGSFLFLGPTGVGKTQTAKAVAQVFFGDRNALSRLDMSEYQADDALERLIGSFDTGKVGTLTTLIKSRSYGVLLLDEFEKANRDVHDLFLQVLDEGFFSDMGGRKVNARNLIFIATSNAGSNLIWEAFEQGKDVTNMKDELVQYVINEGIYRPEFLNRFDEIIVFHPLSREQIREVATLMLQDAQKRIKTQGYELVINEPLIEYAVNQGYDPAFGARPMERAIKDTVEQVIAKKIISGDVLPGDRIELTNEDFSK
ncbi:MAG TPA: ATP-dependent Clp protease ATP-binding subunit [Candidatus Paceibacterota bacterium]|nr:ATP-dependent Clp protease ATP-binding subunit [Candidatus Paceibacterota bacterium]